MDSIRAKDSNCNGSASTIYQSGPPIIVGICSSNSFGIITSTHHELISANSIELNAGASLSDDSGVPLTTNSSISSGDSFRFGVCKYEIEIVESDGEVSQLDSLDNCSESGMSTENFNTLKKGPLAPIDPPPEFQDSPQTTLLRSVSNSIVNTVRRWSMSQSSLEHIKETSDTLKLDNSNENCSLNESDTLQYGNRVLRDSYSVNKHLYSSDSILNTYTDNIYDEPNNIISSSLGTSIDVIDSDASSPIPLPSPNTVATVKQALCPFYQDHSRYFKAIPSDQDNIPITARKFKMNGLSDAYDHDLYYGVKKSAYQYENSAQRKLLYSPMNHSCHYNGHHYHTGIGNRPNSRNSLNSRLSSSHNSLGVSNLNKADDSIFITQAMSHDALLSREISDFYNVPIDSDIYAFPIDMIKSEREYNFENDCLPTESREKDINGHNNEAAADRKCLNQKLTHKNNRNKRKKRTSSQFNNINEKLKRQPQTPQKSLYNENISTEPLHMTLEEVKQFYHTLYSDAKDVCKKRSNNVKTFGKASSNETICSFSSTHSKTNSKNNDARNTLVKHSLIENSNTVYSRKNRLSSNGENINNNNDVTSNNYNSKQDNNAKIDLKLTQSMQRQSPQKFSTNNNKLTLQTEKKSQFTLNLKQKFCSIFRFRKNHNNRCRGNSTDSGKYISNAVRSSNQSQTAENKRNKFQSRALPPLPKKNEAKHQVYFEKIDKKPESQLFHFTSSLEKVKDYGWYWGPLSSEAAEKVLSNEPDGSFIVRDSSDDHYIFSLSFKLNNCVRHVRIEQDQGTFSFGSYAKFKSQTITEFIEKAVEHSRSGRYLFFLHRRPEHGPMRVQLTNPVSRFKHVQSLQHMCRFVILKVVIRKDLIQTLPLPRRLLDYLNYKHCFSEQVESDSSHSQASGEGSV